MEYRLLENGLNSLVLGVSFFQKYLDFYNEDKETNFYEFDKESYLKLTVICLHNCVELLTKKVLSDENLLLIYKDISSKTNLLENLWHSSKNDMPLHDYLITNDIVVFTIEYTEGIKRLSMIFDSIDQYIVFLNSLGQVRNKITHFGISKLVEHHTTIKAISETLRFISEFFLNNRNLCENRRFKEIDELCQEGLKLEQQLWSELMIENFIKLKELVSDACATINQKNERNIIAFSIFENNCFSFNIDDSKMRNCPVFTKNIPSVDSTFLLISIGDNDTYAYIVAIIDYSNDYKPLYIMRNPYLWNTSTINLTKFWEKNKDYNREELNTVSIIKVLEKSQQFLKIKGIDMDYLASIDASLYDNIDF